MLLALLVACISFSSAQAQQASADRARILAGDPVTSLATGSTDSASLDDTPFGVDLTGIVIVTDASGIRSSARANGVEVRSDNAQLGEAALATRLSRFLGQPLSQRLIGEIRAEITLYMRDQNRPLVAVIVPPQEVTTGTVQFIVLPFVAGDISVERVPTGYELTSEEKVLDTVRIEPGDEIAADILLADLSRLNANPFRRVGVIFEPGEDDGTTNMVLRLTDERPWQIYAGYNNNGTQATGYDRLFIGGVWANTAGNDEQLSYQFTASPNTIVSAGGLFDFTQDKAYMSHSVAALLPLTWRHTATIRADYIHSRADLAGPFVLDSRTGQFSLDYGIPVLSGSPAVEAFGGLDIKRQRNELEFAGVPLGPGFIDINQLFAGLRGQVALGPTLTDFSLKGFFSPGGLSGNNTNAAFAAASGNPAASATYGYLLASLNNTTSLPAGFRIELNAAGQVASTALPAIEQFGIGGVATVRGYQTNERAGDHGFFTQAEFHLPQFSLIETGDIRDSEDVYAFLDFGMVTDIAAGTTNSLLGAGLGIDVAISEYVSASLVWGHAFSAGVVTAAGSNRIHASITGSY
jgi:hemolysin activation/secretion protein